MQATLAGRAIIAEQTAAFWFEPDGPFQFTPGQTVDLTIPEPLFRDDGGTTRTFSIASPPGEPRLMVGTRLRGSAMKRSLLEAPFGLRVEIDGPYGSFTLHQNAAKPAVLIAGGIGITPFHCMIGDATNRRLQRSITLVYANRKPRDVAWIADLEAWAAQNPNFRLIATVTDPADGEPWRHETGRVDKAFLLRHLQVTPDTIFYIAGPPGLVGAMQVLVPEVGADPDNVRAEEFAGY
jgi:ferredoxin-NADP reductase